MPHVVVAQGHVAPLRRRQLVEPDDGPAVFDRAAVEGEDALDLAVQDQELTSLRAFGSERGTLGDGDERLVRNRQHREVELRVDQTPGLVGRDVHAQLLEEPQDGPGLHRARRVVIARDQHDRRAGQGFPQALQLAKGEHDRGIGRPHRVEEIARHDDEIRLRGNDAVDGEPERARDIGLALVDARRRLAMVLPRPQVRVGEVSHFHTWNVSRRGH